MDYPTSPPKFDPARAERGQQLLAAGLPITAGRPGLPSTWSSGGSCPPRSCWRRPICSTCRRRRAGAGLATMPCCRCCASRPTATRPGCRRPGSTSTARRRRRRTRPASATTSRWSSTAAATAAGGAAASGDEIVAAEGYLEKPLALLAAGVKGRVIGFGSRSWLKFKTLAGKKLTIVADRAPGESELAADGSPLRAAHLRDYGANVDHWLLNGFADRVWITPDPACGCCKDADDIWRAHGAEGVLELLARAAQGELGRGGWITRLARINDELERQAAIKEAMTEALYQGEPLFKGVPIKLVREHVAAERERLQPGQPDADPDDAEPWEEPISDLAAVLDALVDELGKYIATTPANLDAAALWCGHDARVRPAALHAEAGAAEPDQAVRQDHLPRLPVQRGPPPGAGLRRDRSVVHPDQRRLAADLADGRGRPLPQPQDRRRGADRRDQRELLSPPGAQEGLRAQRRRRLGHARLRVLVPDGHGRHQGRWSTRCRTARSCW